MIRLSDFANVGWIRIYFSTSSPLIPSLPGKPTVVSIVEFGPGTAAPWHMHPGAQELLHVFEGNMTVEIEGKGATLLKTGEAGIIPAELVHLARNESARTTAKALVVHSRAGKDKPLIVVVKR